MPLAEMFQGKIAWQGEVEIFAVTGHAKPSIAMRGGTRMRKGAVKWT
jgi:hypothetical protein